MTVSKRLRYEILRRDNNTCRYCGGTAPDVVLTIDHVVPVALGGADDPSNLVAACKDCNAGKSASSPDATIVSKVSDQAVRWKSAMLQAAAERCEQEDIIRQLCDEFLEHWNGWTYADGLKRKTIPLPGNYEQSIRQFHEAGLNLNDLTYLVDVAMSAKTKETWRYFCGCAWKRARQITDRVAEIASGEPTPAVGDEPEYTYVDMVEECEAAGLKDAWPRLQCYHGDIGDCQKPFCIAYVTGFVHGLRIDERVG